MLPLAPRRVLLVGDVHGDVDWWNRHVLRIADRRPVEVIAQVGDFGIWPGPEGMRYLDWLEAQLEMRELPLVFVDGNHEDFDQLLAIPMDEAGWRWVRPHIAHAPRGHRWVWSGVHFMALGGAASHDREHRVAHESWWPQEVITEEDVARACEPGAVDILLSHDAPLNVEMVIRAHHPPTAANRALLQRVVETVQPRLIVHGHWHTARRTRIARASGTPSLVISLSCDGKSGACAVLDLDTFKDGSPTNDAVLAADSGPTRPVDVTANW